MKKVLFIGDVHGRFDWRETANEAKKRFIDEIVFLGDYLDSFDKEKYSPFKQIENLKSIISFARKTNERKLGTKVTLLLGNHDYAYIHDFFATSGYQHAFALEYKKIFEDNHDLFKVAWGIKEQNGDYTLATHAGLTNEFYKKYVLPEFKEFKFLNKLLDRDNPGDLLTHEVLNLLIDKKDIIWRVGSVRGGGDAPGILWADHSELLLDPYKGIDQVFGHTVNYAPSVTKKNGQTLYRIDTWWDNTPGLVLNFDS